MEEVEMPRVRKVTAREERIIVIVTGVTITLKEETQWTSSDS